MANHTIVMLLKFGQERHIKSLFNDGIIYMNPIQYFRKLEDGQLRGDKYEGVSRISNYPAGEFEIKSLDYKGHYISLHIRESYPIVLGNIYSFYCISSHGWEHPNDCKIDNKIKDFGSFCIMIKDVEKFLFLIENELRRLKLKYRHGFVDYYDKEKVERSITLFEKPLEFEY